MVQAVNKQNDKMSTFCTEPWSGILLRWGGRVQPCCSNSTPLGDIYKDSMDEIWNGEPMQNVRRLMREGKYKEAGCHSDCPIIYELNKHKKRQYILDEWADIYTKNITFSQNINNLKRDIQSDSNIATCIPVTYDIQTTEFCNMDCIMCHQDHHNKTTVPPEFIQKMFSDIEKVYWIRFQGGEVFVDKSFIGYLLKLKESLSDGQKIIVITNGALVSEEDLDILTEGDNPINFYVSMDALSPDIYKKIRNSSNFEKVKKNILHLSKIQQYKNNFEILTWNFVIMKSNFHLIQDAIRFANEHQIKLVFLPIVGKYEDENLFIYPHLREAHCVDYIKESMNLVKTLGTNVSNLQQTLDWLSDEYK